MPDTIFSLTYVGILMFNTNKLFEVKDEINDAPWYLVKHFVLILVISILIISDMALRVSKLNSQVYNVDAEVNRTLTLFKDEIWDDEHTPHESPDNIYQKEFSFYQDCFTLTLRN